MRADTNFHDWVKRNHNGEEYRTDLDIRHYHRDDFGDVESADRGTPSKTYRCNNAFPIRNKVAADLDSTASDISVQELDIAMESFDVVVGG